MYLGKIGNVEIYNEGNFFPKNKNDSIWFVGNRIVWIKLSNIQKKNYQIAKYLIEAGFKLSKPPEEFNRLLKQLLEKPLEFYSYGVVDK